MKAFDKIVYLVGCWCVLLLSACHPSVPTHFEEASDSLSLYPDYRCAYVPVNIAPLNFCVMDSKGDVVVSVSNSNGTSVIASSDKMGKVCFPIDGWKNLMKESAGDSLLVDIYVQEETWKHSAFRIYVVADSIDPFVTYRLIEPSYQSTGKYGLYQFNLETAERTTFVSNKQFKQDPSHRGQMCMNCHTKQLNHQGNSVFHYRVKGGGMVVTYKGETHVVATKVGDMIMPAIYSQWHPSLPYITFSNNTMNQIFLSQDKNKIEPMDWRSDILLYDVEKREVSYVLKTKGKTETYPTWSPDGKYMYYCSSDSVLSNVLSYKRMKYDLMRVEFNADSVTFGEPELIYSATSMGKSVAKPRVSPDGRYILMTISSYGAYHFTHGDSDVYLYDSQTKECKPLEIVNSDRAECYTMWSSNGRWLLVSSRAEDGNYVRLYFSYFDEKGVAHKLFQLPQRDPLFDKDLLQNYNYPEFGCQAVDIKPSEVYDLIYKNQPIVPSYRGTIDASQVDAASGASVLNK